MMDNALKMRQAASLLHQTGQLPAVEQICRQVLAVDPRQFDALHMLGLVAMQLDRHDAATDLLQKALVVQPDAAAVHSNLAIAWAARGMLDQAIESFRAALRLEPSLADVHNNLGVTLLKQGNSAEAVASLFRTVSLLPDHADAWHNLGTALDTLGQPQAAVASYRQAVRIRPDNVASHRALAELLFRLGESEEAGRYFQYLVRQDPHDIDALLKLGFALKEQKQLTAAIDCWRQILRLRPDHAGARSNLAMSLLLVGDFEQGWIELEWRVRLADLRPWEVLRPRWQGEPLAGRRILLHAEAGLGDTFQFIRYANVLKHRGATVLLLAPKKLAPLLRTCPGIDQVFSGADALPMFDVHLPLMSLPLHCGTRLDSVPAEVPYLTADPERIERWRQRIVEIDGYKVGIHWQGDPSYGADHLRSMPLAEFAPLASVPGVRLMSVQSGLGTEQIDTAPFPVHRPGSEVDEPLFPYLDLVAILKNVDLVITSDTALAHLAGALGVPVWVALPCAPDWRWLLDRADTPWYPTMRLFRQPSVGDWRSVFATMAAELQQQFK